MTTCYTGAISDSSASAYRRRYWVWAATIALSIATVTLAYVEPISSFFVTLFSNIEDWNPDRRRLVRHVPVPDLWALTHLSIGVQYSNRNIDSMFLRARLRSQRVASLPEKLAVRPYPS